MVRSLTRRELLRDAAVGLAALATRCGGDGGARRRRVAIIGGGMAGVSTAWLLEGTADVVLFEAKDHLGGNARTREVEIGGRVVPVDLGAELFHPGPYPTYAGLLQTLGLFDAPASETDGVHELASTLTIHADGEPTPRFVSPGTPDRAWAIVEEWNQAGLGAFFTMSQASAALETEDTDWDLTVDEWLATLDVDAAQRDELLVPWIASLYSGDVEQARGLSARSALTFLSRAVGPDPLALPQYYTLAQGMGRVIDALAAQAPSAVVHLSAPVDALSRSGGRFRVGAGALVEEVDAVVLAAPPYAMAPLLADLSGAEALRAAMTGIEFHDASLALHLDPAFAAPDPAHWSFFNARVAGGFCEGSMWLAPAIAPVDGQVVDAWKSWVAHRDRDPADVLATAEFRHMLPTPATLAAQRALAALQGEAGLYVAAGTTQPYDSQETALTSALTVAATLTPDSERLANLGWGRS